MLYKPFFKGLFSKVDHDFFVTFYFLIFLRNINRKGKVEKERKNYYSKLILHYFDILAHILNLEIFYFYLTNFLFFFFVLSYSIHELVN